MRKTIASTAVAAGLALGVAMGCSAQADPPTQALESSSSDLTSSARPTAPQAKPVPQAKPAQQASPTPQAMPIPQGIPTPDLSSFEAAAAQAQEQAKAMFGAAQAQIADATARLEAAFAKQFQQAAIDRAALGRLIDQAVQAFPEPARAKVKLHIDEVIETGQQVAPQMTPEERNNAVTPPEQLGQTQQGLIAGWGWGAPLGFGGLGAFGFPGMFGGFGFPGGLGWGGLGAWGANPALWSFPAVGFGGCAAGLCGTGLGMGGVLGAGGWFW
jgi:hypothetical protein